MIFDVAPWASEWGPWIIDMIFATSGGFFLGAWWAAGRGERP